jgi:hypothetical protein
MTVAADEVSIQFEPAGIAMWRSQATCRHGVAETLTQVGVSGIPNHVSYVENIWRQHQLVVGCDCPYTPYGLNATVTCATAMGVQPGALRIILEQSATTEPGNNNFSFHGRLTCRRTGAYYIDASVQLAKSVASGARGVGQVFAAGNPPMLSAPMIDVAGKATSIMTGLVNLYPNQPLAIAYLNTGTTSQDVTLTTLKISEVWVP